MRYPATEGRDPGDAGTAGRGLPALEAGEAVTVAREAFKLRAEIVERSFAHNLDRGGMRRTWLRGRENVHKRYLLHVAGHNLSLLMRQLIGAGTPKEAVAGGIGALFVLVTPAGAVLVVQIDHLQFDRGVLSLRKVGNEYRIRSKASEDPLQGKTITLTHTLEDEYVIPTVIDQNPCAHLRMPRDMIFHGWSMRLFQAWQHSATMSS